MIKSSTHPIKKILLVDDDIQFVKLVKGLLREEGYIVHCAYDGHMAIAMARSCRPDVILMDVNLPFMDGLKAFGRLRAEAETRRIPVIFVSEVLSHLIQPIVDSSPRAAHLKKPFDLIDLTSLLRQFVQSYAA